MYIVKRWRGGRERERILLWSRSRVEDWLCSVDSRFPCILRWRKQEWYRSIISSLPESHTYTLSLSPEKAEKEKSLGQVNLKLKGWKNESMPSDSHYYVAYLLVVCIYIAGRLDSFLFFGKLVVIIIIIVIIIINARERKSIIVKTFFFSAHLPEWAKICGGGMAMWCWYMVGRIFSLFSLLTLVSRK